MLCLYIVCETTCKKKSQCKCVDAFEATSTIASSDHKVQERTPNNLEKSYLGRSIEMFADF